MSQITKNLLKNINKEEQMDFLDAYETIINLYKNDTNCPCLLFTDDGNSCVLKDKENDTTKKIFVINKNCDDFVETIKILNELPSISIPFSKLKTLTSITPNYYTVYKTVYLVSCLLDIPTPAVYIVDEMDPNFLGLEFSDSESVIISYNDSSEDSLTKIYVKAPTEDEDFLFTIKSIIHELRHIWQIIYHGRTVNRYIKYAPGSAPVYLEELVEIDAEAFACFYLCCCAHKDLSVYNYDSKTENAIRKRIIKIQKNFKKDLKLE